jgi:hypothetical protein
LHRLVVHAAKSTTVRAFEQQAAGTAIALGDARRNGTVHLLGTSRMVNPSEFLNAIRRVKACYMEDPGLAVRLSDLARLIGIPIEVCTAAVKVLDTEGVLQRRRNDQWVRSADMEAPRRR